MTRRRLSKSIRTFIRREKARFRLGSMAEDEYRARIEALYARFGKEKKNVPSEPKQG